MPYRLRPKFKIGCLLQFLGDSIPGVEPQPHYTKGRQAWCLSRFDGYPTRSPFNLFDPFVVSASASAEKERGLIAETQWTIVPFGIFGFFYVHKRSRDPSQLLLGLSSLIQARSWHSRLRPTGPLYEDNQVPIQPGCFS
jgi:hypothetical protein